MWNLKSTIRYKFRRVVLTRKSVYFSISNLTQPFSYFFHVPCTILSSVYFYLVRTMFPFPFNRSQSKTGVANQISRVCFRRRSTIGQVNVQTTTAEKKKNIPLSNIIYIKIWSCSFSGLEVFLKCSKILVKFVTWSNFTFRQSHSLRTYIFTKNVFLCKYF